MAVTITDGTDVSTVLRTNLVPNPLPASTTGWVGSTGDSLTWIASDGGAPCIAAVDGNGAGSVYADPSTNRATPEVGQWVAFAVEVKALDATTAAAMRLRINGYDGTTLTGGVTVQAVTTTEYTRLVVTAQADTSGGYVRTLIWPTASTPTTGGFRFRLAVLAVADTEAGALAGVSTYFDGNTPADGVLTYAWTGAENASSSEEVQTLPHSVTPTLVLDYSYEREARTIAHTVLDRSDPDVTLRPVGLRTGTLNLFCATRAIATDAEEMHRQSRVLTLTSDDEPTADMTYVATGSLSTEWDATNNRWTVRVGYQEVTP